MLCLTWAIWSSRLRGMKRLMRLRRFSMKPTVLTSLGAVEIRLRLAMRVGIRYAFFYVNMESLESVLGRPTSS